MIDHRIKLTVIHDNNGTPVDKTEDAVDFARDAFNMDLFATDDYLYVGFDKPFGTFYTDINTPNTVPANLSAEIYDGTAWVAKSLTTEGTKAFTRSGFISWDKAGMESTTFDSKDRYWIRIQTDQDQALTNIYGMNVVFSDDFMMKQEFDEVTNSALLPSGRSTHIMKHVAARDEIMQELRNDGYIKKNSLTQQEDITPWDLHDHFQIRQAATYLALSKVFFNLADGTDDNWWAKYLEYMDKYKAAYKTFYLSVDSDDDGVVDDSERERSKNSFRWVK